MSKKKLFLITDFFPFGTGETFVMTELRCLYQRYDVTVIPRYASSGEPRALPEGVKLQTVARSMTGKEKLAHTLRFFCSAQGWREIRAVFRSGDKRLLRLRGALKYFVFSEHFWEELVECGVTAQSDGAIYYSFWHTAAVRALSAHRKSIPNSRIVTRIHGYDLYAYRSHTGYQPFRPTADEGIDRVVFCCRYGKEYYLDAFHVEDGPKYVVIPLGSENAREMPTFKLGDRFRLVSCSGAVAVKRIERIIQGLEKVQGISVDWTHIGGGLLLEKIRELAVEKLVGKENIRWTLLGNVEHDQVLELYENQGWDAFITTSATEGSPVSIQEALSFGFPVIATAVGGIPELLEDTENILLSDDPDGVEVAEAIVRMASMSPEERERLRQGNRHRWEENYCAATNGQRMIDMMEELW